MSIIPERIFDFVSRETEDKFEQYRILLESWNRNTSLVQIGTIDQFYIRHILDSLQLIPHLPVHHKMIDLGTGAGFPGMVLSIAGIDNITLCDSNQRKIVFLKELARIIDVDVCAMSCRIEDIRQCDYDVVLSRACSDLTALLEQTLHVSRETEKTVTGIFLKGRIVDEEIKVACQQYDFNYEKIDSITSDDGVILKVYNIRKL
ncbi:MAG: 16S rRNA (guanine(527)-N(7))-methyltransferase RsmG [Candidatus Paracaedibacteraceae bacterium]|nr:16S rRNA (guanine(527)-N(7))-methyltransferase RsmG [Candidatus Paracaedibacteraceae bacterium]